jgi:polyferredoxin
MVIDSIPKVVGMVYAIAACLAIVLLFRSGRFNRRTGYLFLLVSASLGFLVFAPMLPNQLQALLLGNTKQLSGPVPLAIGMLSLFTVVSLVFGRVFCGYVCPVGAIQEIAYLFPVKKLKISNKAITIGLRLVVSVAFVVLAVAFSIALLRYLGLRDFFYLKTASVFFFVFLAIAAVSVFVYRPFCRLGCPYGALLSLASAKGLFKLRRNEDCINCEKCGEACPTNEVGWTDLKQECYMCNRCMEACPVDGMEYTRRHISEQQRKKAPRATPGPAVPQTEGLRTVRG